MALKSYLSIFFFFQLFFVVLTGCKSILLNHAEPTGTSDTPGPSDLKPNSEDNDQESSNTSQEVAKLRCDLFFSKLGVCAEKTWIKGPRLPLDDSGAALSLRFFEKDSSLPFKDISDIKLSFWSKMGHGNDFERTVVVEKILDSQFRFSNMLLNCEGADWILTVVVDTGSQLDSQSFVWTQKEFLGY